MMLGIIIFVSIFSLTLWALKFDNDDKYIFEITSKKLRRNNDG